jgi:predicted membrane protein
MEPNNAVLISSIIGIGGLATYLSLRFKKETRSLTALDGLLEKMYAYYRLASFYYWAAFALSIVATSLLYLFADVAYAVVYAFILFWMSIFRPTSRNLVDLFDLKEEEKLKFLNNETID